MRSPSFAPQNIRRLFAVLSLGICVGLPWHVAAADLSMLSDFGRPDIPAGVTKGAITGGDVAGISQTGALNRAYIDQAGQTGNNAESWQEGVELSATITQSGASNAARLSQTGSNDSAVLLQQGTGNQMAISQLGANVTTDSSQIGDGNQLVLVQQAASQFTSTQIGNQNQLLVDLPASTFMNVNQTGNNMYLKLSP
jgi:hypothetical protein